MCLSRLRRVVTRKTDRVEAPRAAARLRRVCVHIVGNFLEVIQHVARNRLGRTRRRSSWNVQVLQDVRGRLRRVRTIYVCYLIRISGHRRCRRYVRNRRGFLLGKRENKRIFRKSQTVFVKIALVSTYVISGCLFCRSKTKNATLYLRPFATYSTVYEFLLRK